MKTLTFLSAYRRVFWVCFLFIHSPISSANCTIHCCRFDSFTTALLQGFDNLQEIVEKWEGLVERSSRSNLKLFVDKETYEAMDSLAKLQNKNIHQLAMEVIRNFVAAEQNDKSE